MSTPSKDTSRVSHGSSGKSRILQLEVGMMQNFNELIADPAGHAAVVDPAYEVDRLLREAEAHDMRILAVLVTHTHHDHIDGVDELVRATGARVYVGRGEADALRRAAPTAELVLLDGGENIAIGELVVTAIATPGHTLAGISYLVDGCVCTGDSLFVGGCGRTDFPGGDAKILWASLQRLAELPEETRVYPGHDYGATLTSTISQELHANPYLRCPDEAAFVSLRTGKSPPKNTRGPR